MSFKMDLGHLLFGKKLASFMKDQSPHIKSVNTSKDLLYILLQWVHPLFCQVRKLPLVSHRINSTLVIMPFLNNSNTVNWIKTKLVFSNGWRERTRVWTWSQRTSELCTSSGEGNVSPRVQENYTSVNIFLHSNIILQGVHKVLDGHLCHWIIKLTK